jgi:hypothetical protein
MLGFGKIEWRIPNLRNLYLFCLLFGAVSWGQEKPVPSALQPDYRPPVVRDNEEDEATPASASTVAADAPVLTIKGLCPESTNSPSPHPSNASCQTIITRAQFERLADALQPRISPSMKRQLASSYPKLLAMAHEAEERGLEKNPHFEQRLAFARVQILSQELVRQIEEDAAKVSEKDIEDYYRSHAAAFREATLERIFIPNRKRLDPAPKETTPEALRTQRKEAEDAMSHEAQVLRTRAAAGEDFFKLQNEAYAAAGLDSVPPTPSLGQVRRDGLPPAHISVFELKPGEVSPVISDSTGHYVYRLDAKETETLDAVKESIHKTLQSQRTEEMIRVVQEPITTEVNPAYFGPSEKHSVREDSKPH